MQIANPSSVARRDFSNSSSDVLPYRMSMYRSRGLGCSEGEALAAGVTSSSDDGRRSVDPVAEHPVTTETSRAAAPRAEARSAARRTGGGVADTTGLLSTGLLSTGTPSGGVGDRVPATPVDAGEAVVAAFPP
jgi:hypothetical protein